MLGRLRNLTIGLAAAALLAAGALYAAVPFLERGMVFHPSTYDPARPWRLPAGGSDVWIATEDKDVRLHGWFLPASDAPNGSTVLMLHGNAGTLVDLAPEAEMLRRRGFDILLVDYRGYGRSGGRTLDEATLRLDGAAALAYLTAERAIAPDKIALFGFSLGTVVAAELAVAAPCRAVALVAPLASARRQALKRFPWMPALLLDGMRNRFDTQAKIGRANCPVMVVHGTADTVIPFAEGRAVYDAARQPKRLLAVAGGPHWLGNTDGRAWVEEIASFFAASP